MMYGFLFLLLLLMMIWWAFWVDFGYEYRPWT